MLDKEIRNLFCTLTQNYFDHKITEMQGWEKPPEIRLPLVFSQKRNWVELNYSQTVFNFHKVPHGLFQWFSTQMDRKIFLRSWTHISRRLLLYLAAHRTKSYKISSIWPPWSKVLFCFVVKINLEFCSMAKLFLYVPEATKKYLNDLEIL